MKRKGAPAISGWLGTHLDLGVLLLNVNTLTEHLWEHHGPDKTRPVYNHVFIQRKTRALSKPQK